MSATPTLPRRDGHTHSQFCPHGSREATEQFIERAIALGFETYSLTEHPPLPRDFIDPTADHSCGMRPEDLEPYLLHAQELKKRYAERIDIRVGLEVDYIPGYESDIRTMLNDYGSQMDDALLSVHFLEGKGGWRCVDLSPEDFQDGLIDVYGSVEAVHRAYWTFVKQAVEADLGPYKPRPDEPSKPRAQVSTEASPEESATLPSADFGDPGRDPRTRNGTGLGCSRAVQARLPGDLPGTLDHGRGGQTRYSLCLRLRHSQCERGWAGI